jgi:hypothetical protein
LISYVLLAPVLAALHYFLSGWALIMAWCVLGIILAIIRSGSGAAALAGLLLAELVTGIFYLVFYWNAGNQLRLLVANSQLSAGAWVGVVVGVNVITFFLCAGGAFYTTRLFIKKPIKNPA